MTNMNFNTQILKNSIKFLYDISDVMPINVPSIKSYYAMKSRILELRSNLYLPQQMTKATVRCSRCCLSFKDYPPFVELKPKKKRSKFAKQILNKIRDGKRLTTYQKKYSKNLTNTDCNILNTLCQKCNNETKIDIKIDSKSSNEKSNVLNPKATSKKKKKKDKFCGLKESVVRNLAKENIQEVPVQSSDAISTLRRIKLQQNELKRKPVKNVVNQKSTKEKIIEKKKNRSNQKVQSKLKNLLSGSNKSKLSTNLKNFLQDF